MAAKGHVRPSETRRLEGGRRFGNRHGDGAAVSLMKSLGAPTQAAASMKQMGEDLAGTDDVVAVYITDDAPSLFGDVKYQRLYRRCSDAVAVWATANRWRTTKRMGDGLSVGQSRNGFDIRRQHMRLRDLAVNTSDESACRALVAAFQSGGPQSLGNDRYCKLGDRLTQLIERN